MTGRVESVAVFDSGKVSVEQIDLPVREPGEIDVAITSAAICGSDLHTVLGVRSAPPRVALGHEGIGRITSVDAGAVDMAGAPLREGDRVAFALFNRCGTCDRCRSGLEMKCRSLMKYGHESVTRAPFATGTLASAVRILPGVPVRRLPDDIPDSHVVSAGCAVATAAAIVAALPRDLAVVQSRALVLGAGAVGIYTAAMLAHQGVDVAVSDPARKRVELAEVFGARAAGPDDQEYPVVVEASGNAKAFEEGIGRLDIGGRLIAAGSVSPGATSVTFDPATLVTRRLEFVGIHNYSAADFLQGVEWLLSTGAALPLERLVSAPVALADVAEGFDLMRTGRHLRVLVRPS